MASSGSNSSVVLLRYAQALIDLAEEKKKIDVVSKDLEGLQALLAESEDFKKFIQSPLIQKPQQHSVIEAIAKKANIDGMTFNFLKVLVENGRLFLLGDVIETYKEQISKRSGEVTVQVQTAKPLTTEQRDNFQNKIKTALDRDVIVEESVDPDILGGMVVTIGSYMIDDSVRRKLDELGVALTKGANQNTIQNLKEVG